jgi:uncharacterized integral membrane protein
MTLRVVVNTDDTKMHYFDGSMRAPLLLLVTLRVVATMHWHVCVVDACHTQF